MQKKLLYPSHISARTYPRIFNNSDLPAFEREFKKEINPSYIFQFNNALVTSDGVVIDNGKVVPESLYSFSATGIYGWKYILKTFLLKKKIRLDDGKYFLPFNLWNGYGHWIPETLPRLFIAREILSQCTLLLPYNLQPQLIGSLAPFKFKNTLVIAENTYLKIPNLFMPSLLGQTGNYNDSVMRELQDYLFHFYTNNFTSGKYNVYLSRQKAEKRKIINEDAIFPVLNKFNFKIVYIETLSFEEQVSLFLNTNCLISLHGGALANLLFMRPESKVMEIRNSTDKVHLCFFALASALNINYYYSFAKPVKESLGNNSDLILDPEIFEKTLTAMMDN